VLAGIWITMLHGTTIGPWLSTRVPPNRCGSVVLGQFALVASTVALWMKPVSSKPLISAGFTKVTGSGSVAVTNGATAPTGGLAVPPAANAPTPRGTAPSRHNTVSGIATAVTRRLRQSSLDMGSLLAIDRA
jgi:hypothetical protein